MDFTKGVPRLSDVAIRGAHERFLQTGVTPSGVRSSVSQSWSRSVAAGVDAEAVVPPPSVERRDLTQARRAHPLSAVFPLLYDVLGRAAEDCDCVMAIGDAQGQLLWVCGQPAALRRAESINFVEGTIWNEAVAGTNAPGTALRLDAPVLVHGSEHFARPVQAWSCAAAPIHDPLTREILGILDITGGDAVAAPTSMGLVRAAARMAEAELGRLAAVGLAARLARLSTPIARPTARGIASVSLRGLGRLECAATIDGRELHVSPRHSDILVVLGDQPMGVTGEQLALEVYEGDVNPSTMRAEMTRLRALLGEQLLPSRPYRLSADIDCDWRTVSSALEAGRLRPALRAYVGPLLPQSEAPGVIERRRHLHDSLRAAVIAAGDPDLMVTWTGSRWGAADLEMWQHQAAQLPRLSTLGSIAAAEADRLERELAAPVHPR